MAKVTLYVQTPDGAAGEADFDAATRRDAAGLAAAQGFRVLGFQAPTVPGAAAAARAAEPPPGVPLPGQEAAVGFIRRQAPLVGQVGVPLAASALGVANPLALAALGLAGGLGGAALGRGGAPTAGDVATTAAGEALGPAVGLVARAGRALAGPAALGRGMAGAASKLGIPLSAPAMFGREGGLLDALANRFTSRGFEEQQARAITANVPQRLRALFGTLGQSSETEGGRFFGDVLDRAVVKALPGGRQFPGAFKGGYLDGNVIAKAIAKLPESKKAALFGDARLDVENLAAVLSRAVPAQRALTRLGVRGGAKEAAGGVHIPIRPFAAAITLALGGTAATEAGFEHTGHGAQLAAAGLVGGKGLAALLTSPAGARWLAAGVDAMAQGAPERLVIPALARAFPQVLQQISEARQSAQATPSSGPLLLAPPAAEASP